MTVELLLTAFGLALIIEGLIPALFPNKWRNYVLKITQESPTNIRTMGIIVALIGCFVLWLFY
ncbi:DUF2065 domain-containing protein [Thalassotalea sp. 1_MG-2023]|uniref:DUF2065 domain-containing protein n=1 Tax=Thalassotalea sp. 1_MG-2023 TaxID=3062680 RepID=UPI0026E22D72|nr:DUF2065 domain-containing protein [Thalassotalea sp. 1_MG-2023]MDO6425630.1 DUF2065 domain-containing protein [Thalassotalea sp. 1_MG-2023]